MLRPACDAIGRALTSLVAAALREIGKHAQGIIESPTKADESMLLPLAQKMPLGKHLNIWSLYKQAGPDRARDKCICWWDVGLLVISAFTGGKSFCW